MTPILDELGIRDQFTNLQQFTYDNKVIGLPVTGSVEGIFYNKKIFADLGVLPPKSYEELVKRGYLQAGNLRLQYQEQQKKIMAGEAAMLFDGSWISKTLIDPLKSHISNEIGFFSFPDLGGRGDGSIQGSFVKGYGFSAKLTQQQKEGIKQFIKQMFNQAMQNRQYTEEGLLPSMVFADNSSINPLVSDMGTATKGAATTFPSLDTIIQKSVTEALDNGLQLLLSGKTTAVKLTEVVQKSQTLANTANK